MNQELIMNIIKIGAVALSVASAVLSIVILLCKHKRGLIKKLMEWASESFADGKITREEFHKLCALIEEFKHTKEEEAKREIADNGEKKIAKKQKVKKAKQLKDRKAIRVLVYGENKSVLSDCHYKNSIKAKKGVKKTLKSLMKAGVIAKNYEFQKIIVKE